jgi:septal ring factor EnvC (AmiA/AmiB activator)
VNLRSITSARRSYWAGALCGACLLVLPAGCGRADDDLAAARRAALEAGRQLDDLDTRVDELATAIQSTELELASSDRERERLATRLERTAKRLRGSLTRLRNAMGEAQASSSDASSAASTALARAEELVRSLAVLQNRYDYHLRHHHGGG